MARINLGHVVGPGIPSGGTAGQILKKASATDYDTAWMDEGDLPGISNLAADLADEYSALTVYQEGDFCTKDTVLYKRNSWGETTPAAEAWTAAHWTAVTATDEIQANRSAIATNASNISTNASAISGEATARRNADTALSQDIGKLRSDIGIVEDTNTATHTIASGQYVIWKGELYKAKAAIPSGTTLSTSNLDAVSNGIANELNGNLTALSGKFGKLLWTNTSPTSTFSEKSIYFDLTGYKMFIIEFKYAKTTDLFTNYVYNGSDRQVASIINTNGSFSIRTRSFVINATGFYFYGGYKFSSASTDASDDDAMIPVKIYGIA